MKFILKKEYIFIQNCFFLLFIMLLALINTHTSYAMRPERISEHGYVWENYIDMEHGFSVQIPVSWKADKWNVQAHQEQEMTVIETTKLDNCTNSKDYLNKEIYTWRTEGIVPCPNLGVDGFIVKGVQLDNITPGCEAVVLNCPYLIRLRVNFSSYPNAKEIFDHMVMSIRTWKPQGSNKI